MSGSGAAAPPKLSYRTTALLALIALSVLLWLQPPTLRRLQAAWFDSMQVRRDPSLWSIPIDPALDFIRSDPRYRAWEAQLPWRQAYR